MLKDIKRRLSYQKSFRRYGLSPKALQWVSGKAAEVRYQNLIKDLDFNGKSVLDVGCGFGDIIPFVERKARTLSYTGVDITPEFIEIAKKKYPRYKFIVKDYFGSPISKVFDIVITCGTLHSNREDPMLYRKSAIKTMFNHAKEVLAFNMAGGKPQPKNKRESRVYYADPDEVVKYCTTLTPNVVLRDNYHPKDFTVLMFK